MVRRVRTIQRLVLDLPGQVRLAYCLTRDPRTPTPLKAAAGAAVALILTPVINIPLWVPVLGEMDAVALLVICLRRYNAMAPPTVRRELEEQLRTGTSQFDRDLASGGRIARQLARWIRGRTPGPLGARSRSRPQPTPSAPTASPPSGPRAPVAPVEGTTAGDDRGGDQL